MPIKVINREQWLQEFAEEFADKLEDVTGKEMPAFRVSCGWPTRGALSLKKRTLGQCWDGMVSKSGHAELFISPVMAQEMDVAATVAHEMVHALVGTKAGHKGAFVTAIRRIGLEGKPTSTTAGDDFKKLARPIIKSLGTYPHSAMTPNPLTKPQTTRMIKLVCMIDDCGYPIRTTRSWLEDYGAPLCPKHQLPLTCDNPDIVIAAAISSI